ncbi:hypothetical protein EOA28_33110, partial [Mesorhizobium sp. M2A.F.Ca.ET.067.02.1.1]
MDRSVRAVAIDKYDKAMTNTDLRTDVVRPYPIFIISAAGGGHYAADFAATFVARVQDRCPNFSQHIFASSVSGGSICAGVFAALAKSFAANGPLERVCRRHQSPWHIRANHAPNTRSRFSRTRDGVDAFRRTLHHRGALTHYVNGQLVDEGWEALGPGEDIKFSTALGLSARFPWIMPAAHFITSTTQFRLVDGGYLDNSGDETAFDLLMELRQIQELGGKLAIGRLPPFEVPLITLT